MLIAIAVTFAKSGMTDYWAIAVAMVIGGGFGAVAARKVKMTAMPQMVALFNGVGGGAAALVSLAELHRILPEPGAPKVDIGLAIVLSALIGSISFAGSMVAFAKLQELLSGQPITYRGQQFVNAALFLGCLAAGLALVAGVQDEWLLWAVVGGASLFGVLFVLPIGGADMPVVISLLNAFTGLAVAVGGFELENNVLIVSGMLVGASGTLLTLKMGRLRALSILQGREVVRALAKLPELVSRVLAKAPEIEQLADRLVRAQNVLYLGRGYNFPVALEGALKLKEISYIHAEGYPAAEMKHGPIALIDDLMPVIFIAPKDGVHQKVVSNVEEVKARGGRVIAIVTEGDKALDKLADHRIEIPETLDVLTPVLSVVPLQLLAYYIAVRRGCNVDQPRNLAKSVTVE